MPPKRKTTSTGNGSSKKKPASKRKRKGDSDEEDPSFEGDSADVQEVVIDSVVIGETDDTATISFSGNVIGTETPTTQQTSYFHGYSASDWNPEWMYRLPGDITLSAIREAGSEGIGRIEIGKRFGIDTSTKSGNRRVSAHIVTVCKEYPEYVGQFQKMEGKVRCIKYFWKQHSDPERFQKLFDDFKRISGRECPFKMGDTLKFPDTGLSTLRMSDVSIRRLNMILGLLHENPVLVTIHVVLKNIYNSEVENGYKFQIDKKSLMKCLKALERERFLNVFDTVVMAENVQNKVTIVCRPEITDVSDPVVKNAIQATIDSYHREGRVFPHGQLRYSLKKRAEQLERAERGEIEEEQTTEKEEEDLSGIDECTTDLTSSRRYSLFRLQCSRTVCNLPSVNIVKSSNNANVSVEDADATMDQSMEENGEEGPSNSAQASPKKTVEENSYGKENKEIYVHSGLLTNGIDEPSHSSTIPSALGHLLRKKDMYDPNNDCGYQPKMIRAWIMHNVVFNFLYANEEATPTVFERFPPGSDPLQMPERETHELPVYVDDETHLRFLAPCPPFADLPSGWFMLQDLFTAMPLSAFVLLVHIHKSVQREPLNEFLRDPIKRHTPLGDLPMNLRIPIFRDKKGIRQLEHNMLILCSLGLAAIATNPDTKRYPTANTSMFYLAKRAELYDTSTSPRGYARVDLPLDRYNKYIYDFVMNSDVSLFWHHLRCISQSTPLNFRMDQNTSEVHPSRHKKYGLGMYDKGPISKKLGEEIDLLEPTPPRDGCAGFDSAMYVHLKRHWDINTRPTFAVSWFITWLRRNSEQERLVVEGRVTNLQKDWNSIMRTLMPSDMEMTRKKKVKDLAAHADDIIPSRALHLISIEPKVRVPTAPKGGRHKKRPLDSVDLLSQQNRLQMRCRFNSREKDMLILIRAVGFYLNPVYRFWLNPSVVRDIMHEYVAESRTKTVQSLMAAGVREMLRSNRLSYLQRIVRNLSTFPEMRQLRMQLSTSPLSESDAKVEFFKQAFNTANRLLFMESQNIPSTSASEAVFERFIASGQATISVEQSKSTPIPLRSQKPSSLSHINHCVASNVLISVLTSYSIDEHDTKADGLLSQITPTIIHNTLQVLRSDGLVSRARSFDPLTKLISKNHATLSYYFRHFFGHRFHPELVDQVQSIIELLDMQSDSVMELGEFEDVGGAVLLAADSFYTRAELDMEVSDSIIQMFGMAVEQNSTKQIRYLESADLQLEKVKVFMGSAETEDELPNVNSLLALLDKSVPEDVFPPTPLEDWLVTIEDVPARGKIRQIAQAIEATTVHGASFVELETLTHISKEELSSLLDLLLSAHQIVEAGVDVCRFVWHAYVDAWLLRAEGRLFQPRPWTKTDGTICASTTRWMAESVLMSVVSRPGVQVKDIRFRYEFAMQPALIDQLVELLVRAGCIEQHEEQLECMQLTDPFQDFVASTTVTYLMPTVLAVQRFAKIFANLPVLPLITSGPGNVSLSVAPKVNSATVDADAKLIPLIED